jgi:hypothetical protein
LGQKRLYGFATPADHFCNAHFTWHRTRDIEQELREDDEDMGDVLALEVVACPLHVWSTDSTALTAGQTARFTVVSKWPSRFGLG